MALSRHGLLLCLATCCTQGTVPPPGEAGPEAVVMAEPIRVEAEIVVEGAVERGIGLSDHAILASREGTLLRREILDDAPTELGTDSGALLAAARFDSETVIAGTEGVFVLVGGVPERSPLDALFEPGSVRELLAPGSDAAADDLWIATEGDVRILRNGALETLVPGSLAIDGARLSFGAPVGERPALWVLANGVASAWTEAGGVFSAQPLDLADVRSLTIDGTGTLWIVAGDALVRRDTDGTLRELDFPEPLSAVFAGAAADLWLTDGDTYWHHAGGAFAPLLGVPDGTPLGVDAIGRLLLSTPEGLARVSIGRPVVFLGLAGGSRVDLDTTVTLAPSFRDQVEAVEATVDDDALDVLADPWRVAVPTETLADGDHHLDVTVRYGDDANALASLYFTKGDVPPVTWTADIEPLYRARCDYCHGSSGGAHRLDTPGEWEADIDRILAAVTAGRMPRLPPRLDDEQIHMIERWRAGGFR